MTKAQSHPAARHAFTLIEVLLALGIFVIGFTMVLALFPAAVLLQKRTVDQIMGQKAVLSATALLNGRGIDQTLLEANPPAGYTEGEVSPLHPNVLATWNIEDRSFPQTGDPLTRRHYWIPLFRDVDPLPAQQAYHVTVFVLRRGDGMTYTASATGGNPNDAAEIPKVDRMAVTPSSLITFDLPSGFTGTFGVGEPIVDSNGAVYRVTFFDNSVSPPQLTVDGLILQQPTAPHEIWYAPRANEEGPSPALAVFTLTAGVVR